MPKDRLLLTLAHYELDNETVWCDCRKAMLPRWWQRNRWLPWSWNVRSFAGLPTMLKWQVLSMFLAVCAG